MTKKQTHKVQWPFATGDVTFRSSCEVNDEFSELNYKPTPDGIFSIWLPNAEALAMSDVAKVKVEFGGSYIPYPH